MQYPEFTSVTVVQAWPEPGSLKSSSEHHLEPQGSRAYSSAVPRVSSLPGLWNLQPPHAAPQGLHPLSYCPGVTTWGSSPYSRLIADDVGGDTVPPGTRIPSAHGR